jgi:hypothetical protein
MAYNEWFTDVSTSYSQTKLLLQGSRMACIIRLRCLKEHDNVLALSRLPHARTTVEVM